MYCKTQNYAMALADLNHALRLLPRFPAALCERGLVLVESGLLERGIADYDRASAIDPTYALAYINKGSAYALREQWGEAHALLSEGIHRMQVAPPEAYINRASCYTVLGRADEAREDLLACQRFHPDSPLQEVVQKQLAALEGSDP